MGRFASCIAFCMAWVIVNRALGFWDSMEAGPSSTIVAPGEMPAGSKFAQA